MQNDKNDQKNQEPAEGSREIIERELKRSGGDGDRTRDSGAPGSAGRRTPERQPGTH